jgi:DNA-nicking Smr family endonuclease
MDVRAQGALVRSELAIGQRHRRVSKDKRDLSLEEKRLWRRVAASVKTRRNLPPDDAAEAPSLAAPAKTRIKPSAAPKPSGKIMPAPADRAGEKRVRRGDVEIGASLDLHGHTHDSARAALQRFLHRAQARGDRAVIVITGVGRGGEGVLKRAFPGWIAGENVRPLVSGFAQAHRTHGGAGAFYVFLKRAR